MEFDEEELKESATHVPDNYEPKFFINPALGQSLVCLRPVLFNVILELCCFCIRVSKIVYTRHEVFECFQFM